MYQIIESEEMKAPPQREAFEFVLSAALFPAAEVWRLPRQTLTDDWMKYVVYMYTL